MTPFDKYQPPIADEREVTRAARERIHKKRRNDRIRFIARIVIVATIPAVLPSYAPHTSPPFVPISDKSARSVETPPYDNRPAEAPEGLSTIRLRRER